MCIARRKEINRFLLVCDEWYKVLEIRGLMNVEQRELLRKWIIERHYANVKDSVVSLVIDKCSIPKKKEKKQMQQKTREKMKGKQEMPSKKGGNEIMKDEDEVDNKKMERMEEETKWLEEEETKWMAEEETKWIEKGTKRINEESKRIKEETKRINEETKRINEETKRIKEKTMQQIRRDEIKGKQEVQRERGGKETINDKDEVDSKKTERMEEESRETKWMEEDETKWMAEEETKWIEKNKAD